MGNIYFVRGGEFLKIGYAADVPKRVAQLQTGSAVDLTLVATIPNCEMRVEKNLHEFFSQDRVRGEWFDPRRGLGVFAQHVAAGAQPRTPTEIRYLYDFAVHTCQIAKFQAVIADPASTHEQLKTAHIGLRHLTRVRKPA